MPRTPKTTKALDKFCEALLKQISEAAPESEPSVYGLAVLTRAGWLQVSVSPSLGDIALHTRFEEPHLARGQVIMSSSTGKWNHYLKSETASVRINEIFARLWPAPEELPRAQFLGAIGRLADARRDWMLDRYVFGPLASRKHLRVVGQPGAYNSVMSIVAQSGQVCFSDQAAREFWDCAAEFGGAHA